MPRSVWPPIRALRRKPAELIETEVKPRVRDVWQQAKPRIDAARSDLAQIASETDPREKPKEFAVRVKQRLFRRKRGD